MLNRIPKYNKKNNKVQLDLSNISSFEQLKTANDAGTLTGDVLLNNDGTGTNEVGTMLNKSTILTDATAQKLGLNPTDNPNIDDAWNSIYRIGDVRLSARQDLNDNWLYCDGGIAPESLHNIVPAGDLFNPSTSSVITVGNGECKIGLSKDSNNNIYVFTYVAKSIKVYKSTDIGVHFTLIKQKTLLDIYNSNFNWQSEGISASGISMQYANGYFIIQASSLYGGSMPGNQYSSYSKQNIVAYSTDLETFHFIDLTTAAFDDDTNAINCTRSMTDICYYNGYYYIGVAYSMVSNNGDRGSYRMYYGTNLSNIMNTYSSGSSQAYYPYGLERTLYLVNGYLYLIAYSWDGNYDNYIRSFNTANKTFVLLCENATGVQSAGYNGDVVFNYIEDENAVYWGFDSYSGTSYVYKNIIGESSATAVKQVGSGINGFKSFQYAKIYKKDAKYYCALSGSYGNCIYMTWNETIPTGGTFDFASMGSKYPQDAIKVKNELFIKPHYDYNNNYNTSDISFVGHRLPIQANLTNIYTYIKWKV